ncbi:putative secreted protein [Stenotrophomonas phage Philippe]|uniref:Secreted protein n=1 Tax=Stenotrophomonas phage Philippe TaxID=2859655 RepID=A0AAE8BJK1_9CAUD|nr:putative secreted protein [Stenotrophomonas phage Philippe]QYW02201.1 putative secreted protein [Stenotrophomonas phage Philippe]
MSNVRMASAALLGTVTQTASTVTNTIGVVSDGVDMLSLAVKDAKDAQQVRSKLNRVTLRDRLLREAALEATSADLEVAKHIEALGSAGKETFESNFKKLEAALAN